MRVNPVSITIHLDLNHKPKDIWNFIFSSKYQDRICPLKVVTYNEKSSTLEFEEYVKDIRGFVLKEDTSIEFDRKEFDTLSTTICSTFKLKNKLSGEYLNTVHFLNPENSNSQNQKEAVSNEEHLVLKWLGSEPAVIFDVHRSKYENQETFYVSITISHGIWGNRCDWFKAMNQVLLELQENKNAWEFIQNETEYLESITKDLNDITDLEKNILDCKEARQFFWDMSLDIIKNFTSSEKHAYVSPKFLSDADRNFDVIVYHLATLPQTPMEIPERAWLDSVWNECLTWDAPKILKKSVKQYWIEYENEERFLKMIRPSMGGGKNTWQDIVDIITRRPETDKMIGQLANWIADINWPGAGEAWDHLIENIGLRAIPLIKEKIKYAQEIDDDWWEETLISLKKDIEEKYT